MFLINRISKFSLNQSYCRFSARKFSEKRARIQTEEKDNSLPEARLKQYEEKLLYNTIIESYRMRYGFKKNAEIYHKQKMFEQHMKMALQSVQPLPLSLKYSHGDNVSLSQNAMTPNKNNNHKNDDTDVATNFPYQVNTTIDEASCDSQQNLVPLSIKNEMIEKKKFLDENEENWMTHYDNYEYDLETVHASDGSVKKSEDFRPNYGTPDPDYPITTTPCGGCGAFLHCKDTAIPGYIPSEILKNSFKPGSANLASILCQRCHFLKEYNIALQVRVSAEDYPKVLQTIPFETSLAILMVDLTDFPCSMWPGIADILGPKAPVVVVGNKVDLLPKDSPKFLRNIKKVLIDNLKLSGFANANIKHIELISAKTGYGVENLITSVQNVWTRKGDIYLIGCTNVGKSSLFNLLLQSDFCKIQASELIQRATTSVWPGTTLNLLKFPVTRFSGFRMYLRHKRLEQLQKLEMIEQKTKQEALRKHNVAKYATLEGHIGRSTEDLNNREYKMGDAFSMKGNSNLLGQSTMGINENKIEFIHGKWCYDTPGVVHPDQILHLLTTDELIKTLPKELIRPETYCIKPGTSLFIAGLARLDYIDGPDSVRLTVFRAASLPITICRLAEADGTYSELLGSDLMGVPILKANRKEKWPGLSLTKKFNIFGKTTQYSSYDVVLSSAGWIAINCGLNHYEFEAWTPEKRGVYVRDSLLPKAVTLRGSRIRESVAYKKHKFI